MKNTPQDVLEAHKMAIKALDQESILNKIKTEIEALECPFGS